MQQKTPLFTATVTLFQFLLPAISLSMTGSAVQAAGPLTEAEMIRHAEAKVHLSKSNAFFAEKRYDEAESEMALALKATYSDAKLLQKAGNISYARCHYMQAATYYTRAIAVDPRNADAYASRGACYLRMGQFAFARRDYEQAQKYGMKVSFEEIDNLEFDQAHQETDPSKKFALACTALLFTHNRCGCSSLAGATEKSREQEQLLLKSWWEVNDRFSLLGVLRNLVENGHSSRWKAMRPIRDNSLALVPYQSGWTYGPDYTRAISLLNSEGDKLGNRNLDAWDWCRYLCLCRWGYQAGYLTEAQAWDLMLPMAAKIAKQWNNYRDLSSEYLVGRQFWSDSQFQKGRTIDEMDYQRLLSDPRSPWKTVPWPVGGMKPVTKADNAAIYAVIDRIAKQ